MKTFNFICPNCLKTNKLPFKDSYKKAQCGYCKNSLLDGKVIEANSSNFYNIINSSTVPVIVDFWAPWCGPCRMMAPNFADASKELAPKVQFVKLNTEVAQDIASSFGIRSIPTLIVFKDSKEVERLSGTLPKEHIISLVSKYIN